MNFNQLYEREVPSMYKAKRLKNGKCVEHTFLNRSRSPLTEKQL